MSEIVLDGLVLEDMEEVHALFAQALEFPDWYGRNLNALFDCLTDLARDVTVRLLHREDLEARLGRWSQDLIFLLQKAAEKNPHIALSEEA